LPLLKELNNNKKVLDILSQKFKSDTDSDTDFTEEQTNINEVTIESTIKKK
jgi:hypothetical protein